MTQNNGEYADIETPELIQTPEAQRQTELIAESLGQTPTLGAVIGYYGETLGVLSWFKTTGTSTVFASIDNGTLSTDASGKGEVTVRIQNPETGDIRTCYMFDVATAFYTLGLRTKVCNGINVWLGMGKDVG
jgi:hypothetical protein